MNKKLYSLLAMVFLLFSCNKDNTDPTTEDYSQLFPWKGIDKPESAYEDMKVEFCSPNEALQAYSGRNKSSEIPYSREYNVTIQCLFKEEKVRFTRTSEFEIRYIDENDKVVVISPSTAVRDVKQILKDGVPFSTTFKVKSGYPMYLLLRGEANQFSHIKAEISAVSLDGTVVVPPLSTEQAQNNNETWGQVNEPYCNYIILP